MKTMTLILSITLLFHPNGCTNKEPYAVLYSDFRGGGYMARILPVTVSQKKDGIAYTVRFSDSSYLIIYK